MGCPMERYILGMLFLEVHLGDTLLAAAAESHLGGTLLAAAAEQYWEPFWEPYCWTTF